MNGRIWRRLTGVGASAFLVSGLLGLSGTVTATEASMPASAGIPACPQALAGQARCMARFLAAPSGGGLLGLGGLLGGLPLGLGTLLGGTAPAPAPVPTTSSTPQGYSAAQLRSAYGITGTGAAGRTVAVVDAMDDPNAEADLAVYRAAMGLPACTTANGCFRKVDGAGGTNYPAPDAGWSREISVDLEMVSAACSDCHILLVEAATQDIPVLGAAEDTAARWPGVVAISNSFGVPEQQAETGWDQYFDHPGIPITAASGDSGYGTVYPSVSPYVIAVGGTSLTQNPSTGAWSETAWSGAGSGCSSYEPKPAWQTDAGCSHRTTADVATDADPVDRRRHLRQLPVAGLARGGRDERGRAVRRRALRPRRQRGGERRAGRVPLQPRVGVPRRHLRSDRAALLRQLPLQRPARVRRADRARHPGRAGSLLR